MSHSRKNRLSCCGFWILLIEIPFLVKQKMRHKNQCAPGSTLSELLQEPNPTNMVGVENNIRMSIR